MEKLRLQIWWGILLFAISGAGMASAAPEKGRIPTVAVLYFDYAGRDEGIAELRKGFAEMLITDLSASDTFHLIERKGIEAILTELHLDRRAKLDSQMANRIGRLLGARYVVMGSFATIPISMSTTAQLRIDARVIEVETGRIVGSYKVLGKQETDFMSIEQGLTDQLQRRLDELLPTETARHAKRNTIKAGTVPTKIVGRYSGALDALDHGERDRATSELKSITKDAPDFLPAAKLLDRLMQH